MSRLKKTEDHSGFYGIGILNYNDEVNVGTLWRSAFILGASFIYTIGKKYKQQGSDVTNTWTRIPLYHYQTFDELKANIPYAAQLIGVEMGESSTPINEFKHPLRAIYLLGSEVSGLPPQVVEQCQTVLKLPGEFSLNVSVAGSIVIYDRMMKNEQSKG